MEKKTVITQLASVGEGAIERIAQNPATRSAYLSALQLKGRGERLVLSFGAFDERLTAIEKRLTALEKAAKPKQATRRRATAKPRPTPSPSRAARRDAARPGRDAARPGRDAARPGRDAARRRPRRRASTRTSSGAQRGNAHPQRARHDLEAGRRRADRLALELDRERLRRVDVDRRAPQHLDPRVRRRARRCRASARW